jgi:2,3-bisphosphoglycerate-independent phosphoglycerate mutase
MGYDPLIYHTGRSPLEAASMGIKLRDTDVAFRTNLVTLKGQGSYEELTMRTTVQATLPVKKQGS